MASRLFRSAVAASLKPNCFSSAAPSVFYQSKRFYPEIPFVIEDFGGAETVQSGDLKEWLKKEGDWVEVDDEVCSIETEKVSVIPTSEHAGVLKKVYKQEGDLIEKGDKLWVIDTDAKQPEKSEKPKEESKKSSESKDSSDKKSASKDSKSDKKSESSSSSSKSSSSKSSAPQREARSAPGSETRVKMSQMRARIAERLKDSQNTAAMLTTFQECDMHNLMQMRSEYKDAFFDAHGAKLGFMSCFVKASTNALLKERAVNAFIDGNEIVYKDFVDINIAVATPTGLVTPVLRDCDRMSFADIEREIAALGEKARKGRITVPDLEAGTFTISNGGVYGSMMGTPIINPPQSAILGMHGITKRPVVVNDQIVIRPMMYLALTYDHRLLDGKTAVTFLKAIKEGVEDPRRLLLDI